MTKNIYHLARLIDTPDNEISSLVVIASSEHDARTMARDEEPLSCDDPDIWLDAETTTCVELGTAHEDRGLGTVVVDLAAY